MAGLLPLESSFAEPHLHLGYREAALLGRRARWARRVPPFAAMNSTMRRCIDEGQGEALFDCVDARGRTLGASGRRRGKVRARSFI